jgi:integrase/recombinase XerC
MNTTTDIVPISTESRLSLTQPGVQDLLDAFLAGKSEATIDAYRSDLLGFSIFLGVASIDLAAETLVRSEHGSANLLGLRYKAHLIERGLSASSINRKLAALRSLVALANTLGLINWHLQISSVRAEKGRVTGVGLAAVRHIMAAANDQRGSKAIRDTAIIRAFFDLALRRNEVCALDLADMDLQQRRIAVKRKGHHDKLTLTLPEPTCNALAEWIKQRGTVTGPLFFSLDHRLLRQQQRLTTGGVYKVVRNLGYKAGIKVHPHQLRHDSITEAVKSAQASGIGLEEVMDFSGHRQIGTLLVYRDRERNVQGQLAGMVAAKV